MTTAKRRFFKTFEFWALIATSIVLLGSVLIWIPDGATFTDIASPLGVVILILSFLWIAYFDDKRE